MENNKSNKNNAPEYEEIDEAEEEALLKSDDEYEGTRVEANLKALAPPAAIGDDDSLMDGASELLVDKEQLVEKGISDDDDDGDYQVDAVGKAHESDDDDDDDDDDMDGTDKVMAEYNTILKELEANKYAYDKYTRLCELAHDSGDLDVIRNSYNMFATVYPLTPELWLKYINVEKKVALSEKEIEKVEQLFRRALSDYYSTDIALQYVQLAMQCKEAERIWNEILGTYALHCTKGHTFFKQHRLYINDHPTMSSDEKLNACIESYKRELKYPLEGKEEVYIDFRVLCENNREKMASNDCLVDWEKFDESYTMSKEHLYKIFPFEEQLMIIDEKCYHERAEIYMKYIKESDKFLDENVLQTVYERMVADCCLIADCWLTYIDFIDYRDEYGRPKELQDLPVFQQSAIDINRRALRNCTWSEKLYIKLMRLMEKNERPREEVQEVLESSMTAGFQQAEPAVAIWLEYLTYLRRHTDWENEGECDILRKNFNLAWTILGQQWGVLADCNCEILQFWGRLEYGPLQDPKRGKELWGTVMESSDNATKSGLWIEYTQLEMRNDFDATRKLYRKALHSSGLDNPAVITSAWERFERCNGTVKTLATCMKECTDFWLHYKKQHEQFTTPSTVDGNKLKSNKRKISQSPTTTNAKDNQIPQTKKVHKQGDEESSSSGTKKSNVNKHQASHTFREHENQEIDVAKDDLRIFLSNLDYDLTEGDIYAGLQELKIVNIDLIRSANGRSRGFGYLELESKSEVEKALAMDGHILKGRPLYISSVLRDKEKRQKFKYADSVEPKKVFVKNLPNDTTKEDLALMFGCFGKVHDVRLVYQKNGKFKNIAYIEYESEEAARHSVAATNGFEWHGHTLFAAISAPPPKAAPKADGNQNKLFDAAVSNKRKQRLEQKPRMSLIPNVVRKQFATTAPSGQQPSPSLNNSDSVTTKAKTNEDFRKLLLK